MPIATDKILNKMNGLTAARLISESGREEEIFDKMFDEITCPQISISEFDKMFDDMLSKQDQRSLKNIDLYNPNIDIYSKVDIFQIIENLTKCWDFSTKIINDKYELEHIACSNKSIHFKIYIDKKIIIYENDRYGQKIIFKWDTLYELKQIIVYHIIYTSSKIEIINVLLGKMFPIVDHIKKINNYYDVLLEITDIPIKFDKFKINIDSNDLTDYSNIISDNDITNCALKTRQYISENLEKINLEKFDINKGE